MKLCRADKVLLLGAIGVLASTAIFGPTLLGLGVPAMLLIALIADGVFRPSSSVFYPTISRVGGHSDQVALTFDDGPDPIVTPKILKILGSYDVHATFFVIGRQLEQQIDVARSALAAGHELANHSWQHAYLQSLHGTRSIGQDIDRNSALLATLSPRLQATLYRAPVGLKNPELARASQARGLAIIAWSIHSRDTIDSNPKRVAARVLRNIKAGDIVLMHDGHDRAGLHRMCALNALPLILDGLKERNLRSVTVSELLRKPAIDATVRRL